MQGPVRWGPISHPDRGVKHPRKRWASVSVPWVRLGRRAMSSRRADASPSGLSVLGGVARKEGAIGAEE